MKKYRILILTTFICLLPMIVAAVVYDQLPEQMVTHWNGSGVPDGYSPKAFACFGLPGIMAGVNLLVNFLMENDPKRKNYSQSLRTLMKFLIPVLTVIIGFVTIGTGLGKELNVEMILPFMIGILFIVIGNYLPKCKQNYTMGIKCPWTLNSEENWNRTHHMGGYLFILAGILMILAGFIEALQIVMIAVIILVAVVPFIYSFWLYKKGI